jgi:hypothetical protein
MGARLSLNPLGWLVALLLLAVFAVGFSGLARFAASGHGKPGKAKNTLCHLQVSVTP